MIFNNRVERFACLLILWICLVQRSDQYTYSCNPNANCGCSKSSATVNRIVGGETAGPANWGWMVSIYLGGYLCGGSILSANWIITAAHCAVAANPNQITVYAGSNTLFSGQSRSVVKKIVHPQYNSNTMINDIALLQLKTPLNMSDPNVKPICIPNINTTILTTTEWPTPGGYAVAAGWGTTTDGGSVPNNLQQVTLGLIANTQSGCPKLVPSSYRQYQLCAGYPNGGKDTCQGDSGGPLMVFTSSQQWVLVGLTSFGNGCALPGYPGIYTRVAYYENWITSMTSGAVYTPVSSNSANINPFLTTTAPTTIRTNATTKPSTTATKPAG